MKGFVFTVDSIEGAQAAMRRGMFSVRIAAKPSIFWPTLADFATARVGDLVFFFSRRFFFGVGRIVGPPDSCPAFLNYDGAVALPIRGTRLRRADMRVKGRVDSKCRIAIAFAPIGDWFEEGVDIDEVLSAPGSEAASALRLMYGKSFHQLAHDEATWLATLLIKRLASSSPRLAPISADSVYWQATVRALRAHRIPLLSVHSIVRANERLLVDRNGLIRREDILHGLVVEHVWSEWSRTRVLPTSHSLQLLDVFHEFWGSPPKQAGDADRMDVLAAYGLTPKVDSIHGSAPGSLRVFEAKKNWLPSGTSAEKLVAQGLKYIDFLARTVTAGDYGALKLSILLGQPTARARVGIRFQQEVREALIDSGVRYYTLGSRTTGASNREWRNHELLAYRWNAEDGALDIHPVW